MSSIVRVVVVLLAVISVPLWVDGRDLLSKSGFASKATGLVASVKVMKLEWDTAGRFAITVRVVFHNRGKSVLVFVREPTIARLTTARSLRDLRSGKYEYNIRPTWSFPDGLPINDTLPTSKFKLLAPGEIYETDDSLLIPLDELPFRRAQQSWTGDHVVQMELIMFPFINSKGEISEIRAKWKSQGYLVSEEIVVAPFHFNVPEVPAHLRSPL